MVAVASASFPLSVVKPLKSFGLDSIHAPIDTVASVGRGSAAPRQATTATVQRSVARQTVESRELAPMMRVLLKIECDGPRHVGVPQRESHRQGKKPGDRGISPAGR